MQLDSKLTQLGFTLQAAVEVATLPLPVHETLSGFTHLLVFGHAGRLFWEHAESRLPATANPIDDYSVDCVEDYLARAKIDEYEVIYPKDVFALDLRQLGRHLGWQFESPLGIGIHPEFGLWFGYRVVVAANAGLPFTSPISQRHPCEQCVTKPCVTACPAGAVGESFSLIACTSERIKNASDCATRCAARLACPVGAQYRYPDVQIDYHAGVSLASLKRNFSC